MRRVFGLAFEVAAKGVLGAEDRGIGVRFESCDHLSHDTDAGM